MKINLIYATLVTFFFLCLFQIQAADITYGQSMRLTLDTRDVSLETVLKTIEQKSEFMFNYTDEDIENVKATVYIQNGTIFEILTQALKNSGLAYSVNDRHVTIYKAPRIQQIQQSSYRSVTGVVVDTKGEAIIGANVMEKGTANGVITDLDGRFTLRISGGATLVVSYISYTPQEIVVGNQSSFNITLEESSFGLDEVVVTALGIKRSEKALGYSVQKVKSEELTTVKGVDIATSLTGKIAGLTVLNRNEFNTSPVILLRGETPLVVIDGIPYENTGLGQVAADDMESISVLKGATASALYGSKGASGAIMISTKRGTKEGLTVSVNSNTMLNMGYLVLPEVQSSYSSGSGGKYLQENSEYIWGDKLDIGRRSVQYNPYTYEWKETELVSKGKDNFRNFLETSFILNNNVNVTYKGKDGSVRTSFTHIYNQGQFPGNNMNKFIYTLAGDIKAGKFSMDASITYNGGYTPQNLGSGYSGLGYMYNMIVWTGTDFDVREFKDYWKKGRENVEQNWLYKYDYNNPYFLANEVKQTQLENRANAQATANYEFVDWLKATARIGSDFYSRTYESRQPLSVRNGQVGSFSKNSYTGYSATGDLLLVADKKIGDFNIGGILGSGFTFYQDDQFSGSTNGGLTVPGFYSLKASKDLPTVSTAKYRQQTNSLYGKAEVSWKSAIFLEVTGRNDWVSTLDMSERSYFYPSVSGSVIASELFELPDLVSFLKLRSSWTMTKTAANIYEINKVYSIAQNVWDGKSTANYPTMIRDATLAPQKSKAFEIGGQIHFLDNRIRLDLAYYTKLFYDIQREAPLSQASGFEKTLINYEEERIKKGWEATISSDVVRSNNFKWTSTFNWGRDRYYYHKIDPIYSTDRPWVKEGERCDWFEVTDWERDPQGNIVHSGGMPVLSSYPKKAGFERADWIWGFTNHLSYKAFTLDFSFDGRVGGKAYNRLEQAMWNSGTHIKSDTQWRYDEVVNEETTYIGQGVKIVSGSVKYDTYGNIIEDTRVFAPNDIPVSYEAYIKTYHPWNGSSRMQNIQDLTFLKLREVSIGYRFPIKTLQKVGINNVHVSLVGQNLFIWTKEFKYSDPDAIYESYKETLNSPAMRYIGINIKVDF
jgi:TonB-linked SusC/RagA family outer membrane protein